MTTYTLCKKIHRDLRGKMDGCQEFLASDTTTTLECAACGCHRNFHQKAAISKYMTEVVYTRCNKIQFLQGCDKVDGCQEFTAEGDDPLYCAVCRCHKVYHRNEITVEKVISPAKAVHG